MKTFTASKLIALIAYIDGELEGPAGEGRQSYGCAPLRAGGAALALRALAEKEGARHRFANGTYELHLAGVKATCTAGSHGLLRNWQEAARRRIREAGANA